MTIQEGLGLLKTLFPQYHSTVTEETVYFGGVDNTVKSFFKAYLAYTGWSFESKTVEEAIGYIINKASSLLYPSFETFEPKGEKLREKKVDCEHE